MPEPDMNYPQGHTMIVDLDVALHGATIARNASPKEVWKGLLAEVRDLVEPELPFVEDEDPTEGESE